jgi:predicted CXXCH cytochrome family protein
MLAKTRWVFWLGALLAVILAGTAWAASLAGSVHDLSVRPDGREETRDEAEDWQSCRYCHTPNTSRSLAPLWNPRQPRQAYTSGSPGEGDRLAASPVWRPASYLCLTCHDGAVAADAAVSVAQRQPRRPESVVVTFRPGQFTDVESWANTTGPASSHPVGVSYCLTPDLLPAPADGRFPNGVRLIDGRVECVSCHNPHNAGFPPFLITSNSGSALCYTCHQK